MKLLMDSTIRCNCYSIVVRIIALSHIHYLAIPENPAPNKKEKKKLTNPTLKKNLEESNNNHQESRNNFPKLVQESPRALKHSNNPEESRGVKKKEKRK